MIHFLAGLPRSGSTLLGALLNQHPKLHVTPTNDLLELIIQARNNWVHYDGFRAQGLKSVESRIRATLAGMMRGFYDLELKNGLSVLDKNRNWTGYIGLIEDILERPIKIICPVRPLQEIVCSFERLMRLHPLTAPYGQGDAYLQQQTIMGRAQALLTGSGSVALAGKRLLEAIDQKYQDRLMFVSYDQIISDPISTCISIFAFLELKPIQVNPNEVQGPSYHRDVDVWGLNLHKVRPVVGDPETNEDLLTEEVNHWIDNEFARLQKLAQI